MKKYITVILKEKTKSQDPRKRIKKVALGYAFNYLIPQQIAEISTRGKIKHLSMLQDIMSKNQNLSHSQNTKIKNTIDRMGAILVRKTCSPNKLIFGSISEQYIANQIFNSTGQRISKRQVRINTIKQLGKYKVEVVIEDNFRSAVGLHILPK